MYTKHDLDRCKTLAQAMKFAFDWFGTLVTYRDATDLCSTQLLRELMHDGATLDDPMVLHPVWGQLRQQIAVNVFAGWARRKRTDILSAALHNAEQEVEREMDAAGIKHGGRKDIAQMLSNYIIWQSPSGDRIFEFLSDL